ncbi:hypothetical protein [Streptomyces sp. KL118A]|uniref:hypothetical protein n=1 Tax=Streptomyces sp. KL118A TaxID=3045153 RepID=UPI00278BBA8D|nr:hypothetical protein [Streptomyces sp. KL118A]
MSNRWNLWQAVPDRERQHWELEPFEAVGPLHFGMSPGEVSGALRGATAHPRRADVLLGKDQYGGLMGEHWGLGLMLYYGRNEQLRGVAVDALLGPQVFADGAALVGRVPSHLEHWLVDRAECREPFAELVYPATGVPGSRSLGVMIGVQRSGDNLLTRPVFLSAEATQAPSCFLPPQAWTVG